MKYLDEYRDARIARGLLAEIAREVRGQWVLMEICGGQTHTIMRYGLDELLPKNIELVHGPGCPVCVTPLETIDKALELASRPDIILVSYGDMLRVPGSTSDLFTVKAQGGDVRIVYSRPPTPWRSGRRNRKGSQTFPCWFRTCSCRRRFAPW
jgi:hydrogenase expression/formation protein HypD